jgi:hypothetical protein
MAGQEEIENLVEEISTRILCSFLSDGLFKQTDGTCRQETRKG